MVDVTVSLPHHMDGIAINLPAYLAGLPEEAYLSEFQVAPEVVEEESESSSDEIPVDGIPAEGCFRHIVEAALVYKCRTTACETMQFIDTAHVHAWAVSYNMD